MIDEIDRQIIQELQQDGRRSYVDISKTIGVTEGTVRSRVKHLRKNGVIKIVAIPNVRQLAHGFVSFVGIQVSMKDRRLVAENLTQNKHVCYLSFVSGRYDLIAIIVTGSPEGLSQFIEKEISSISSILRIETYVNLEAIKGTDYMLDTTQLIRDSDSALLGKVVSW